MTHLTMEQISSHVDDTLESEERAVVREHVQHCSLCRGEVDQIKALRREIKSLPREHVDAWFAEHMETLVMGEEGNDQQWAGPERIAARTVLGLAVVVVVLLIGLLLESDAPLAVSERNLALGSTDSSTQILMSFAELSKDDLLMATMTGD